MGLNFNGILLYGPPGVGKTYIARAIAGEYNLNFMGIKVSDMTSSVYAGSSEMISRIFKMAAKNTPCIVFFDEFDSVAKGRSEGGLQVEDTRIVAQLLRSIEDVRSLNGKVIVMAATNDKDSLDEAVIRPGRFDRHIMIPMPDIEARKLIIDKLLRINQ
jgi:transitional endoplasmic reticulum ATPase